MDSTTANNKRILILYYSFSAQTGNLIQRLAAGLTEAGAEVVTEKLTVRENLKFPIGNIPTTLMMMLTTFMRKRVAIDEIDPKCFTPYDLIVLAGPTWSYNPSGPVLSLLDRDGKRLFAGKKVLPLISCRGYWRTHWWGLKSMLVRCGAQVVNRIIFTHPSREPWRTIGVFLKLAGRMPERGRIMGRYYPRYGHSKRQQQEAVALGRRLGQALLADADLSGLDLSTSREKEG